MYCFDLDHIKETVDEIWQPAHLHVLFPKRSGITRIDTCWQPAHLHVLFLQVAFIVQMISNWQPAHLHVLFQQNCINGRTFNSIKLL